MHSTLYMQAHAVLCQMHCLTYFMTNTCSSIEQLYHALYILNHTNLTIILQGMKAGYTSAGKKLSSLVGWNHTTLAI